MLIQPDSYIRLIKNCPLDNKYEHTIYFDSTSAQQEYFNGLEGKHYLKQSYQRYDRGVITLQDKIENIYNCNYMVFRNLSFENKNFYAFVNKVEYVSNLVCRIYYEIDVLQTWLLGCEIKECFVEREHSTTDNIGDNTVPEGLETGEYISSSFIVPTDSNGNRIMSNNSIVVVSTFNKEGKDTSGGMYGGIYTGLSYNVFETSEEGIVALKQFLSKYAYKSAGILCILMMPSAFVTEEGFASKAYDFVFNKETNPFGFTPENNKLFTHPYNFLYVTNLQGNSAVYRFELFDSGCEFSLSGDMSANPSVVLAPQHYKGVGINYDEKLVLTGFPQCPYTTDIFKAWLAQNASSVITSAIGTTNQLAYNQAMTDMRGSMPQASTLNDIGAAGAMLGVTSSLFQVYNHSVMPDQAHSGQGSSSLFALGLLQFALMQKHIRDEYAQIIDNYFTMYGYATKRVKKPNISARPCWNYVKTIGFEIIGAIPAADKRKLCDIFDRGITFWKRGEYIGNYSLNNKPIVVEEE